MLEYITIFVRFLCIPRVMLLVLAGISAVFVIYATMVGWKEACSRLKRKRIKIIAACSAAVVVFAAVFLSAGLRVPTAGDCKAISPLDWKEQKYYYEQDTADIKLNFADKERISLGFLGFHGKYGFRKELVIKEPTAFSHGMLPDFDMENIRFGIYRDKNLTDPVDEADAGYNLMAEGQMEEGAVYADFPDYKTCIFAILQPGTYYAAVYSTSPFDGKIVSNYNSWYDVLDSDLTLNEGEYQYFYAVPGQEYEFPFTVLDNTKISLETANLAGTLTLYDTDGKTALKTLEIKDEQSYEESKRSFTFEKGGTYSFRLTDYPKKAAQKRNYSGGALYPNWLRYTVEE